MNGIFYVYFHRTEYRIIFKTASPVRLQYAIIRKYFIHLSVFFFSNRLSIALLRKTYSGSDLDNSEQFYWKGDYSDLTFYWEIQFTFYRETRIICYFIF